MDFNSKKASTIVSGIVSLVLSMAWFSFINDPEGPNLLVIAVLALILYFSSLAVGSFITHATGLKRLLFVIGIQIIIAIGLYFLMN